MTLQTGSAVANMMHNGANDSRTINEMKLWSYVNLSDSDGDNTQLNVQGYIYARQGMQSDNNVYFTKDCRVFDTLYVGGDGRGDSTIAFYDDNSNTWRALRWDDSSNTFTIEDNANQQKAVIHSGNYGVVGPFMVGRCCNTRLCWEFWGTTKCRGAGFLSRTTS